MLLNFDSSLQAVDIRLSAGYPGVTDVKGSRYNDRLAGDENDNELEGGPGNDSIYGGTGGGDDTLLGGDGNDRLYGGIGDDALDGGVGNDRLSGGSGDDTLRGGAGNDEFYGGTGDDELRGGPGYDRLFGGPGNDSLLPGAGYGYLKGGPGRDVFDFRLNNEGSYHVVLDFSNEDTAYIRTVSPSQEPSNYLVEIGGRYKQAIQDILYGEFEGRGTVIWNDSDDYVYFDGFDPGQLHLDLYGPGIWQVEVA